ncbi:hypothetical protein VTN00DRAFT_5418 [Thermoascus crustaceus]|uniref:uncharacterized protein n=1 Tax=Thermoascus crustaceus TaxID=5088 RepID=UPI003742F501
MPGHSNNPGNDAADRLAKEAAGPDRQYPFHNLLSRDKGFIRDKTSTESETEWKSLSKGAHLRRLDATLPSVRARRLYSSLPRSRTYLLTQLRTGHSWLATHGKLHRLREDDRCECGAKETVVHVLVDCLKLRDQRRELRRKIEDAFNNTMFMLGGRGQESKEWFEAARQEGRKTEKQAPRPPQALMRL